MQGKAPFSPPPPNARATNHRAIRNKPTSSLFRFLAANHSLLSPSLPHRHTRTAYRSLKGLLPEHSFVPTSSSAPHRFLPPARTRPQSHNPYSNITASLEVPGGSSPPSRSGTLFRIRAPRPLLYTSPPHRLRPAYSWSTNDFRLIAPRSTPRGTSHPARSPLVPPNQQERPSTAELTFQCRSWRRLLCHWIVPSGFLSRAKTEADETRYRELLVFSPFRISKGQNPIVNSYTP